MAFRGRRSVKWVTVTCRVACLLRQQIRSEPVAIQQSWNSNPFIIKEKLRASGDSIDSPKTSTNSTPKVRAYVSCYPPPQTRGPAKDASPETKQTNKPTLMITVGPSSLAAGGDPVFLRRNSLQRLSFIPVCAATCLTANPMVAVVVSWRILAASPPARPPSSDRGRAVASA